MRAINPLFLHFAGGALAVAMGCGRLGYDALENDASVDIDVQVPPKPDAEVPVNYDYCETLPSLKAPPTIDGVLDDDLPLQDAASVGWTGPDSVPSGHDARFAIAYHPDGIYVFADVDNPVLLPAALDDDDYCGDGIEFYLDGNGDLGDEPTIPNYGDDAIQLIFAAPSGPGDMSARSGRYRNFVKLGDMSSEYVLVGRTGGYIFEALIRSTELAPGAITSGPGEQVGVNLSFNLSYDDGTVDEDTCPTRRGQFFHHINESFPEGTGQLPFANNQAFCKALILD